jgi:hypothetical protein
VDLIAASFAWPFRGAWGRRWAIGLVCAVLLPIAFVPLLGYAVAATRSAASDPTREPPAWSPSQRLFTDGLAMALLLILLSAPFALALNPLAVLFDEAHLWHVPDRTLSHVYSLVAALFLLALPWGLLQLLVVPHATRRFAITGRIGDLFDFSSTFRSIRLEFPSWNLVAAAMVTAWTLGVACVGLVCLGFFAGLFYAILVSAYACATLQDPAHAEGAGLAAR